MAYKPTSFWRSMDTLGDRLLLEEWWSRVGCLGTGARPLAGHFSAGLPPGTPRRWCVMSATGQRRAEAPELVSLAHIFTENASFSSYSTSC